MKFWSIFRKTMREISRDRWMLGLTLAFAPFFVFLYWLWFQGGSTVYPIAVINLDKGVQLGDGSTYNAGDEVERGHPGNHLRGRTLTPESSSRFRSGFVGTDPAGPRCDRLYSDPGGFLAHPQGHASR